MAENRDRNTNPWIVLVILCLGVFMALLDLTIVNIAIPNIVSGLGASFDQLLWVLNAYSLVYVVLLITCGRLGDIFGPRNLFALGVLVFAGASAASGLAHNPYQLIAARAGQGLGAALLAPQPMPLITSLFPPERRGGAFATIGGLSGLAIVAGPTLGGLIVTHLGWPWIFYVNVPVGLVTVVLALALIPDLRPGRRHRLDLLGVLLASSGLLCVAFGLIEGQRYDWGAVWGVVTIPEIIGVGLLLLVGFAFSQALRQDAEPLVTFTIFRDRNYSLMNLVVAGTFFGMIGLLLPLTIYYQSVLSLSAIDAGLVISVQALAMMFTFPVSGALANRAGKQLLLAGLALFAAGLVYIAWTLKVDAGRWALVPGLILDGVGMGLAWAPAYSMATYNLKPEQAGVASGLLSTAQELGAVLAGAAVGSLLQNRLASALDTEAVQASVHLPPPFASGFVAAFREAAKHGLEIGVGQTGARVDVPPGVPGPVAAQLRELAVEVFRQAFVSATRVTLILPIAVVIVIALASFAVRRQPAMAASTAGQVEGEPAGSAPEPVSKPTSDPSGSPEVP